MKFVNIDSILSDPANVRKHSKKNIEAIKASLKRFGQQKPIVVDKDNIVRAGNGTLQAAKELKWTEIGIIYTNLQGSDITAYSIADNRTGELAEWEDDDLSAVLQTLEQEGYPLDELGFDDEDLAEIFEDEPAEGLTDPDAVPEDVEPVAKLGDLWILGRHRVMCGDATKKEDVERLMDGKKADMVITSPPYGVNLEYEKGIDIEQTKDINLFLLQIKNILINGGIVCWNTDHNTLKKTDITAWHHVQFEKMGFTLRDKIAWIKPPGGPSASRRFGVLIQQKKVGMYFPNTRWETIAIFEIGERKRFSSRLTPEDMKGFESDVWELQSVTANKNHPAQFPLRLITPLIMAYSGEDENIFDSFLGSGTTLIAAEQLDRTCYGMEIEPKYVDVIIKRWENFTGQTAVKQDE